MKTELKEKFLELWKRYFGNAELPITFYYTTGDGGAERAEKPKSRSCIICEMAKVRNGKSLVFNADTLACGGARKYLGYTDKMRPGFEYFLSYGNDQTEGERYIRTPEMVKELMKNQRPCLSKGKTLFLKDGIILQQMTILMLLSFLPDPMYYQDYSPFQTLTKQNQTEHLPHSEQVAERLSIIPIWKACRRDKEQSSECLILQHGYVYRKMH